MNQKQSIAPRSGDPFLESLESFFEFPLLMDPFIRKTAVPSMDVSENHKEIKVELDIPRYKKINVEVENNILTISGEISEEQEEEGKKYYRRERRYGSFQRSVTLPPYADIDKIESVSKDGTLTITIPKTKGAEKKKINVKVQ